jgi:hypothetical protein
LIPVCRVYSRGGICAVRFVALLFVYVITLRDKLFRKGAQPTTGYNIPTPQLTTNLINTGYYIGAVRYSFQVCRWEIYYPVRFGICKYAVILAFWLIHDLLRPYSGLLV